MRVLQTDVYPSRKRKNWQPLKRQDPVLHGPRETTNGPLTPAELESFEHNGFLFQKELFTKSEVSTFHLEVQALLKKHAQDPSPEIIREPSSQAIRSIFSIHQTSQTFRKLCQVERLAGVARQILADSVYLHQSRLNLKPGFQGKEFFWHSDFETWHVEDGMPRMRALSCSIFLTENYAWNGPVMVIPGSHMHYLACVGETPEEHYKKSLRQQEIGVPSIEGLQMLTAQGGIQVPTGPAGSVLFFDCNLMHGSAGNISPAPRNNLFFVYNSMENALCQPFGPAKPRPEFIACRNPVPVETL